MLAPKLHGSELFGYGNYTFLWITDRTNPLQFYEHVRFCINQKVAMEAAGDRL